MKKLPSKIFKNSSIFCDETGTLHLPMAALTSCLALIAFYLLVVMHNFRIQAEEQLAMDDCIFEFTKDFMSLHSEVERDNRLIILNRASLKAGGANNPYTATLLRGTLLALFAHQETLRLKIKAKQLAWITQTDSPLACHPPGTLSWPIQTVAWSRALPDDIGPQALTKDADSPEEVQIKITRGQRYSTARMEQHNEKFKSKWTGIN